jgi:hypothetical protein
MYNRKNVFNKVYDYESHIILLVIRTSGKKIISTACRSVYINNNHLFMEVQNV